MTDSNASDSAGEPRDESTVSDLIRQLDELEDAVDSPEERHEVRRVKHLASDLTDDELFGDYIGKYTTRDLAEAFVGAVLFSIPLLVEDGVFDIAEHLVRVRVSGVPIFFAGNIAFIVVLTYGLIYWADIQRVDISRPILGIIPRRLLGVLSISFLTVLVMMTLWGRLENWADPVTALARVSVVWTIAAFGAGLGDIIPGESAGQDINDVLADR